MGISCLNSCLFALFRHTQSLIWFSFKISCCAVCGFSTWTIVKISPPQNISKSVSQYLTPDQWSSNYDEADHLFVAIPHSRIVQPSHICPPINTLDARAYSSGAPTPTSLRSPTSIKSQPLPQRPHYFTATTTAKTTTIGKRRAPISLFNLVLWLCLTSASKTIFD